MAPLYPAAAPGDDPFRLGVVISCRSVAPLWPLLFALATGLFGWRVLRRHGTPVAYWVGGWTAAGISGALALVDPERSSLAPSTHVLGAFFAGLLAGGALSFAGRRVPDWLLPAALTWGSLRTIVSMAGFDAFAWLLAFAWEPWAVAAAAGLVWRSARATRSTRAERWLGPALLALAIVGSLHVAWLASGRMSAALVALWVLVAPPVLWLQIQASADQLRRRLGERLRATVAERTAELRASEERYRAISELNADTSFRVRIDSELRLRPEWVAGGVVAMAGVQVERLADHGWLALLPEELRAVAYEGLARLPVGERFDFEQSIVALDGGSGGSRCASWSPAATPRA